MNSSDAGVAIWHDVHPGGLCRATHQSACNTGFSYLLSGETFWAIMYYIYALLQWIISVHVFEDDTVAMVTVSKANLNVFFGFCWALPRSLLLRCFAFWRNANLAGGFAGRFWLWFCCFWLCSLFVMICHVLDHTCPCTSAFHRLRNCKDRA